ncbi:MAG: hypothetical protein ACI8X3_000508 [Saprospiraceae bacterium]|jgi:hypothetical protein
MGNIDGDGLFDIVGYTVDNSKLIGYKKEENVG